MKKALVFSVAAVLLFSCTKQELAPQDGLAPEAAPDAWTGIVLEGAPLQGGAPTAVMAGFPETKAQFDMNGAGTYARLSWKEGDTFQMVAFKENSYLHQTYTATEDGSKVAFSGTSFSGTGFGDASGFYCMSPASAFHAMARYFTDKVFLASLPQAQVAAEGSPDPNALLTFAWAETEAQDLSFNNFVSLFKFRLSGANAANVKSITLRGLVPMSGNVPVSLDDAGKPQYLPGISFGDWSNSLYRYVTLTPAAGKGFKTETDYYFAVLPGASDGFTLTFELEVGGDSKTITKTSSKTLVMNRSRITDIGTVAVGTDYDATSVLTPYMRATQGAKPVTLAVLSEGYQESELPQFRLDAKRGMDALFNTEPFKTYKNYFNVWFLEVASNESGARISDGTAEEQSRDCYFRSTWGKNSYDGMNASADKVFAYVEDHCPDILDGTHTIDEVPVLLIINDTRYGGIAHAYSNGKTYCMVPKSYDGSAIAWKYAVNGEARYDEPGSYETKAVTVEERIALGEAGGSHTGDWTNTLVHEFGGHSFGRLLDEYWYNTYYSSQEAIASQSFPVPYGLNVSGYFGTTPWDVLLDPDTQSSMAAADARYGRIGKYQGADVSMFNRWRSEKISCMIDNRLYFSAWQRRLIVNRIMTLAGESEPTLAQFLSRDVTADPLRDGGSPVMRPADGVTHVAPPHPAPPMVPAVLHQ